MPRKPQRPCRYPAAHALQTVFIVKITPRSWNNITRSSNAATLPANATAELGNESETDMSTSIRFASSA